MILLSIICLPISGKASYTKFLVGIFPFIDHLFNPSDCELVFVTYPGLEVSDLPTKVKQYRCVSVQSEAPGYGNGLRAGFSVARGVYILTVDSDMLLEIEALEGLWNAREQAEIIIASRYIAGGQATIPSYLLWLSKIVNYFYRTTLSLPVMDISSSLRLYQSKILNELDLHSSGYEILPELITRSLANGWRVLEIAHHLKRNSFRGVRESLLILGRSYFPNLLKLWRFRNSIDAADYDLRAYDSRIYFQRYWQRRRYHIITNWIAENMSVLDIGCGTSQVILNIQNIVGLDIQINKLRYLHHKGKNVVNGTLFTLPFAGGAFDCVVCSEVIEHVPFEERIFSEFNRMLKHGGLLILGTPDYNSLSWVTIEFLYKHLIPGGYADEHVTHYTLSTVKNLVQRYGFQVQEVNSILKAEIILLCKKV